jgi:hypothetical protein
VTGRQVRNDVLHHRTGVVGARDFHFVTRADIGIGLAAWQRAMAGVTNPEMSNISFVFSFFYVDVITQACVSLNMPTCSLGFLPLRALRATDGEHHSFGLDQRGRGTTVVRSG